MDPRVVRLETQVETAMKQIDTILTKVDKLDERMRSLEKYFWVGIGCLGLLQFIAPIISQFFGVTK